MLAISFFKSIHNDDGCGKFCLLHIFDVFPSIDNFCSALFAGQGHRPCALRLLHLDRGLVSVRYREVSLYNEFI